MNLKLINRIIAAIVFIISFIVLYSTVQPSVSFWDCGEFIAAGYYLQVPHPPGTPFFLLLGRIFSMIPFAENIAFKVNIISVLSSAFSVLFLYLIAVKLIKNIKGEFSNNLEALGVYIAAAIGALSFSFSDTFWFNGTEAEVYALSTFLFALVVYLIMRWYEKADQRDNEKYLLMIAYLIGISTGVHLMSVLAIVPVVMVIIFRKYLDDEEALKKTGLIFLVHAGVLLLISLIMWGSQTSGNPPSPDEYEAFDSRFRWLMVGISAVIMGIFWKQLFNKNSFYMPILIGGIALFVTYPGVVKYIPAVMAKIAGDNEIIGLVLLLLIMSALALGVRYSIKENKPTLHLIFMSFIFIFIGFTTFAMVIIRANQDPPMNENEPDKFSELVSYLNREQYGDFPIFKRRFATEPHQQIVYNNYNSDLDFFWSYQMNHMMTRYFLWNYAGRESWDQDSGVNIAPFNGIGNFFGKPFNLHFNGDVKDSLFAVPLLIGLIGIFYHFKKDWKMASVFMIMFILMGYLTAFYQNQQQPQPRERDYFYVGAFFVFSIWIAIGMKGLIDYASYKVKNIPLRNAALAGIILFGIILVPVKMLSANYFTHDRSENWVPWDYSYNLLQSCDENSILFTNGDNDTFPLWYLQDVEGVRRDVKIVNLSLLNTSWYIKQLKNNDPYNVGTVNMRLSDQQIENIGPMRWEPRDVTIPVPDPDKPDIKDMYEKYDIEDSTVIRQGNITFRMNNTLSFGTVKAIRVQDIMVREIVEANAWKRPIYFAVTCSEDSKIGLSSYLKMEGMTQRLVPEKNTGGSEFVNQEILKAHLFTEGPNFSKSYNPGFNFRGLNNPDIFFDENHIRMTQNYRNAYIRLALSYLNEGDNNQALYALDTMEEKIPHEVIPMELGLLYEVANLYFEAGAAEKYAELASEVEEEALIALEENPMDTKSYWNPYRILLDTYQNLKEYEKLAGIWERLAEIYPNDPSVKANLEKYRNLTKKDNVQVDTVPRPENRQQ